MSQPDTHKPYTYTDAVARARHDFRAWWKSGAITAASTEYHVNTVARQIANDVVPEVTMMLAQWIIEKPDLACIDVEAYGDDVNAYDILRRGLIQDIATQLLGELLDDWDTLKTETADDNETQEDA